MYIMGVLQFVVLHIFFLYVVTVSAGPSHCGSNSTISRCANNSKICGEHHYVKFDFCKLECACKPGFYYDNNKQDCVSEVDCSEEKHNIFNGIINFFHPHKKCNSTNNEIYVRCSNCFTTCQTKVPPNLKPLPGCVCGKGFVLDETNNECLPIETSRDKCNIKLDEVIDKSKNFTLKPGPLGSVLHLQPEQNLDDLIQSVWGNRTATVTASGNVISLETKLKMSTKLNEIESSTVVTSTVNTITQINETGSNVTTLTPNIMDNKTSTLSGISSTPVGNNESSTTESAAITNITASLINSSSTQSENASNGTTKIDENENSTLKTSQYETITPETKETKNQNIFKEVDNSIEPTATNTGPTTIGENSTKRSKINPDPIGHASTEKEAASNDNQKLPHSSNDHKETLLDVENNTSNNQLSTKSDSHTPTHMTDVTEGKEGVALEIDEYIDDKAKEGNAEDTTKENEVKRQKRFAFGFWRPNQNKKTQPNDLFRSGIAFEVNKHLVRVRVSDE